MYLIDFFIGAVILIACIAVVKTLLHKPDFDFGQVRRRVRNLRFIGTMDSFRFF